MIDTGIVNTGIRLKQGDCGSVIYLKIYNNGNTYYDKTYLPDVYFKRPDGSTIIGTASEGYDNMYVYVIVGNELEIAGTVIMDVKFKFENGRESSASASFECVTDTIGKKIGQSGIYWNDVVKTLKELEKVSEEAKKITNGISEILVQIETNIDDTSTSSKISQSYAVGGTGTRTGEDTDNAKYYKEQAELVASSVTGALKPMGTIAFDYLPGNPDSGWMYNISDEFITDARFKDGEGIQYPAGTNVYYTYDGFWDCLAGDLSKLIQQNQEVKANIGETDISGIGDGTITGALTELHEKTDNLMNDVLNKVYPVGSIYMSVSPTNPANLFGGTWAAWGTGRVPVGINTADTDFNTVGKTGGAKTQDLRAAIGCTHANASRLGYKIASKISNVSYTYSVAGSEFIQGIPIDDVTHSTPVYQWNGQEPSTLQPYITCYMWKRTA